MPHAHPPLLDPPAGLLEMVCSLFADDPAATEAYAVFAAQIDLFLARRGVRGWGALDMPAFLAHAAQTPAEAATLCCMVAAALPWLVREGDLTAMDAERLSRQVRVLCDRDADALLFIEQSTRAGVEVSGRARPEYLH